MVNRERNNLFQGVAKISAILSQLVGAPLILGWIGIWLDSSFLTKPFFFILLFLLGLATGGYSSVRLIQDFLGDD